jgi:ferrous iron transport protein A
MSKPSKSALPGSLAQLTPGTSARIDHVENVDDPVGQRLSHLGFLPGTAVTVVRRAPLGDPTVFELRGNQMCLRVAEANRIMVRDSAVGTPAVGTPE